jgi:hypothetical protein
MSALSRTSNFAPSQVGGPTRGLRLFEVPTSYGAHSARCPLHRCLPEGLPS